MTTTNIIQKLYSSSHLHYDYYKHNTKNFTALRIYTNDYYKHNTKNFTALRIYIEMTTTNIIQKLYSSSHTHK